MKVELRNEKLSHLRKENYVPGVMYGKSVESTNIKVEKQELLDALANYGKNMTFKIRLDGKYHHVYIKNVQSRVLKPSEILHFDLHRVTAKESITSQIPIELTGQEKFYNQSVYVDLLMNEVTAEYIPGQGQSSIVIDVSNLELGDQVLIKDLETNDKLKIKANPDEVVVSVKERKVVEESVEDTQIEFAEEENSEMTEETKEI